MKSLLILTVVFTVAAFGVANVATLEGTVNGDTTNNYTPGGVYDRLATAYADLYNNALAFGQVGPYWMADDFEAETTGYTYDAYRLHYIYFSYVSALADTFFEVYETDLNTSPIADFTVNSGDISEATTGWTFAGRNIYLGEFPFPSDVTLTMGEAYWTAISMDSTDGVFAGMMAGAYDWNYAMQDQGSGFINPGHTVDISCMWDGVEGGSAVESASLGTLKASFK